LISVKGAEIKSHGEKDISKISDLFARLDKEFTEICGELEHGSGV
jgi:hypothetical protein